MKQTGTVLIVAGAATTVFSIVSLANMEYDEHTDYNGTRLEPKDPAKFMLSVFGATLGGSAFVGGIVLNRIGNRKLKEYSDKLENVSLNFNYNMEHPGVQLVYKF